MPSIDHGMTPSILKRLCNIVQNSKALYTPDNTATIVRAGSLVLLTDEVLSNGDLLIIAVQANINVGHKSVNRVASIYGKPPGVIQGMDNKDLRYSLRKGKKISPRLPRDFGFI